jgi:glycosyltransferase involved in cell wall biosynthesis
MPDVSILIPAYASAAFIDRTLLCARRQTHEDIAILVSVDRCDDGTAERAHAHAADDRRIGVFVQRERLGWAANVNFLLDQTDTPFRFLYFHDDLIEPAYTATLLAALRSAPAAASAHCDMGHFGGGDSVSLGRAYAGPAFRRLLTFMLAPYRGSPLRSMTRADAAGDLRLPHSESGAVWANEPFLMALIARGPALHVPQILYRRWDKRGGGLTDSWRALSPERVLAGHKANLVRVMSIIDDAARDENERRVLECAAYLYILPQVRALEAPGLLFRAPEELHPRFAHLAPPAAHTAPDDEIAGWLAQRWGDAQADLAARRAS